MSSSDRPPEREAATPAPLRPGSRELRIMARNVADKMGDEQRINLWPEELLRIADALDERDRLLRVEKLLVQTCGGSVEISDFESDNGTCWGCGGRTGHPSDCPVVELVALVNGHSSAHPSEPGDAE